MLHIAFSINNPVTFISAGQFLCNEEWTHSERIINSYEIIMGVEGELFLQQDNTQYEIRKGNMILLLPGVTHRGYRPSPAGTSFFWMHFLLKDVSIMEDEGAVSAAIWHMARIAGKQDDGECILPLYAPLLPDNKLDILFHQLLHVSSTPYYTHLLTNYFTTALLIQLCQNYLHFSDELLLEVHPNRTFENVLEYVRMHCCQKLSVSELADRFSYNANYFSRMFKLRTGTSFTTYVNTLRINSAKTLLYSTNLTIKEIAWQTGFEDEKYFMKVFRGYEGLSPTQYRNAFYLMHQNIR